MAKENNGEMAKTAQEAHCSSEPAAKIQLNDRRRRK